MTATLISDDRVLLVKAKAKACQWMPFLQSVFMPMRCTPTNKVPTAAVDKYGRMYYNPDFFSKLSVEVVAYIILHETLHCVLSHHKRTERMIPDMNAQKAFLANIAQDLCIQQALREQIGNFEPADIVTLDRFKHIPGIAAGKTSEQYYEALTAWQNSQPKPSPPPEGDANDEDGEDEDEEQDNEDSSSDSDDGEEEDDSDSGSGDDSDEDGEEDEDGDGNGGSEEAEDAEDGDEGGDGDSQGSDSDGNSGDTQDSSGESDGEAEGSGEASGPGSGEGSGELDTTGLPDMGDVCNPAHAGSGSDGIAKEWEEDATLADISGMEKKLRDAEQALDEFNPSMGSGAGRIRQSLKARLHPIPDPFEQLKHVVSRSISAPVGVPDLTYRKWPRRQMPGKVRLRGVQRLQPEASVLLDTSGSMLSNKIQERALAVVAKAISRLQNPRIVCCDGAVQSAKRVANMSNFTWDGGGGTDMTKGLVYVDQTYKPDSIVIITDGITHWPMKPTRAKVICALCSPEWAARIPKWITVVHLYRQGSQYAL